MIRDDGGHEHLGRAGRACIVVFIPDEGRFAVDHHGLIGAFPLKCGNLQRLDVHGSTSHRLNGACEGECDGSGGALVVDGDYSRTLATIELRGTHGNVVSHLRMCIRMEIVDNESAAAGARELSDARESQVDAVSQATVGASFGGTLVDEIVRLEIVRQRHFPAEVIK